MLHITLTTKTPTDDPTDPLDRTFYGWGEHDTTEENWRNNCGYWVLGARANRESYVLFSHNAQHNVVMAAKIQSIVDAAGKPGRKIIKGEPLPDDHPVYQAYVGKPTPESARVRNPVTYFDSTVGGWLCGCGCGDEIFAGEFLRWFDAVRAGAEPASKAATAITVSRAGKLDLSISQDGAVRINFTPTDDAASAA
jgi:hypothetical protein